MKAALFTLLNVAFAAAQCMTAEPCTDPRVLSLENSECRNYHIFISRGSDSKPPGHQAELVRLICDGLHDCGFESIIYPANSSYAGDNAWCESAAIGASAGQRQLTDYANRCPDSKLIVLGFSQGASVALDYLGGGGGPVFKCVQAENPPLDRSTSPGANIVAVAVFGAVVRSAGQPYSVKGGEDYNGTSTRTPEHLEGLKPYAGILRDYCNLGDPVCAKNSEPADVQRHLNYFELYNEEASKWVIETAQNTLGGSRGAGLSNKASMAAGKASSATACLRYFVPIGILFSLFRGYH